MLVYAGIDEAGYGPMLGPLCVSAAAFVLEHDQPEDGAPNLWTRLNGAVCRRRSDRRRRIAVDDSKRLKVSTTKGHPLRHLERGVLAFAAAFADPDHGTAEDDNALFGRLGAHVAAEPWYGSRTPLPLGQTADELRIALSRLRRAFDRAGVVDGLVRCEAIDARAFNDGVERQGTKSNVNFAAVLRLIECVWRQWPDAHPRIIVDRQGGRVHYRDELLLGFPDAQLQVLAEAPALSRYRLRRGETALTLSFMPEAENGHFPVALASMTAKFVRELHMIRMNRFFTERLPELKPTAGYVQDARRYLDDIEPVFREMRLPRQTLVRSV